MKKKTLKTSDGWQVHRSSKPGYYIVDCRISNCKGKCCQGKNIKGQSMFFYLYFIQIWIEFGFYSDSTFPDFLSKLTLSKFYPDFTLIYSNSTWKKSDLHWDKIWIKVQGVDYSFYSTLVFHFLQWKHDAKVI